MQLLIPAWDTCFWCQSPQMCVAKYNWLIPWSWSSLRKHGGCWWLGACDYMNMNKTLSSARLTPWGHVVHCASMKYGNIGSENDLLPKRRQAFIWTNSGLLSFGTLGADFSEIFIKMQSFSSNAKYRLEIVGFFFSVSMCWGIYCKVIVYSTIYTTWRLKQSTIQSILNFMTKGWYSFVLTKRYIHFNNIIHDVFVNKYK